MPQSKNRKGHKKQLNKFKTQQKQMNEAQNQGQSGFPPVRNVPVWANDAVIPISGTEFELLYNAIMTMQGATQAINGIMSRNILNGTIQMDFEKLLNPATGSYGHMTVDEKAPYVEDFKKAVENVKSQQLAARQQAVESQSAIVGANGEAPAKEEAKVVEGDFGQKPKKTRAKKTVEPSTEETAK